jgi:hypothetical protein
MIDFQLNIAENKTSTQTDYLNSFSYNQTHSIESLKFFYSLFKGATLVTYFLVSSLCTNVKISTFLIQYIHKKATEMISNKMLHRKPFWYAAVSVYIRYLIGNDREFEIEKNMQINTFIQCLIDNYLDRRQEMAAESGQDLNLVVDCLVSIYDDESIYYDDKSLLENLLALLFPLLTTDFTHSEMRSFICLVCLAYKSNLIENQKIYSIYETIKSVGGCLIKKRLEFPDLL